MIGSRGRTSGEIQVVDIPKDNWPEVFKMSGRGGERQEMAESYNTLKTQEI